MTSPYVLAKSVCVTRGAFRYLKKVPDERKILGSGRERRSFGYEQKTFQIAYEEKTEHCGTENDSRRLK